jgi:hypothetical protein
MLCSLRSACPDRLAVVNVIPPMGDAKFATTSAATKHCFLFASLSLTVVLFITEKFLAAAFLVLL